MLLTRTSQISGRENTVEIPMTEDDFNAAYARWRSGALVQNAFPNLSADQREFIKTGITPQEWDEIFSGMDD